MIEHFGTPRAIFEAEDEELKKLHKQLGSSKQRDRALEQAQQEIRFMKESGIRLITEDSEYFPYRLKECPDAPQVLYSYGDFDLNSKRIVSIVGTRKCTSYGISQTEKLVKELADHNVIVVSGLAYGIDESAHKSAVKYNVPTVGVLGHGLDKIYPAGNRKLAAQMLENGGLLTEFPTSALIEKVNFPRRNRIVAGVADCVVVIESMDKGGSLITASIAWDYNRDVFAFPGRAGDSSSAGTNRLIRTSRAQLITSAEDLVKEMGWETDKKAVQPVLKKALEGIPGSIQTHLRSNGKVHVDELSRTLELPMSDLSIHLLEMEMEGHISTLPGNYCELAP